MIGRMHESHYYKGRFYLEEENYVEAIDALIEAIDASGEFNEHCAELIGEIAGADTVFMFQDHIFAG